MRPPFSAEMKYLPIFGLTVPLVCYADLAVAKTPAQIESISNDRVSSDRTWNSSNFLSAKTYTLNLSQEPQAELAEFDREIQLNPNDADAYYNRGNLKYTKLKDPQGALADFDRAIQLNPNLAYAYNNRGILKKDKLNDTQGALADLNQAARLYQQQGNNQNYHRTVNLLRKWGQPSGN